MAQGFAYSVDYHFEAGGKICSPLCQAFVNTADQSYNSIKTAITNNPTVFQAVWPGGTLVIDSVASVPGAGATGFYS